MPGGGASSLGAGLQPARGGGGSGAADEHAFLFEGALDGGANPASQKPRDVAVVVLQRVDEQKKWDRVQAERLENYRSLERGQRQQWGELYRRHEQERRELSQDWGSIKGRVRQWRTQGKHWDELIAAMRGKAQVRAEWDQVIEWKHRHERAELVREHGRRSRGVEQEADRAYQSAMKEPLQVGAEDKEALALEGMRQADGLSISLDRQARGPRY